MHGMRDVLLRARIVENSRLLKQFTSTKWTEVRGARAERSVFLIQPIKELICGVTVTVVVFWTPWSLCGVWWRILLGSRSSDNQFPTLRVLNADIWRDPHGLYHGLRISIVTLLWLSWPGACFLQSHENFSGPKCQLSYRNPLVLKSWSFNMLLMSKKPRGLRSLPDGLEPRRCEDIKAIVTPRQARKVSGLLRNRLQVTKPYQGPAWHTRP